MQHGGEQDAGRDQEGNAAVESVEGGEELPALRSHGVHGAHPAQDHRGVQEGDDPGEPLEEVVPKDTQPKGRADEDPAGSRVGKLAAQEFAARQEGLGTVFVPGGLPAGS